MRVVFRTDASPSIGTGHAMRCFAVAQALKSRGAEVDFVGELTPHLVELVSQSGFARAEEVRSCDWLIVDHYGIDADWERRQRAKAGRIMVIDDLADRPHDCDLLLDQNVLGDDNPYRGLVPAGAQVCLGPRYALLRGAFAAERERRSPRTGALRRALVCFGGSDPGNHTAAALEALLAHAGRLEAIDVVIGAASPHADDVAQRCRALPRAALHRGTEDMAGMLARADLAIGGGGTMTWERACLGVPTLAFGIAANQVGVLESLFRAGAALGEASMPQPDASRIAPWIARALQAAPDEMRAMGSRAAELVDGHGARRVADALWSEPIRFRRATIRDADDILRWRNHPRVRAGSHDRREIDATAHADWMQRVLADPARVLLIGENAGRPVGVVRFDLAGSTATISVYRTPEAMEGSRGLIRAATAWLRSHRPEVTEVRAEILADNAASLAAFRRAGYTGTGVLRYAMAQSD